MTVTADFAFVSTVIPERVGGPGRPAEHNPFLSKVAELVDEDGYPRDTAVAFIVADEEVESEAIGRIKRQLARAGIVHNVSVFKRVEEVPEGVRVTFWAQNRIVPVRKPKDAESNGSDVADDEGGSDEPVSNVTTLEP